MFPERLYSACVRAEFVDAINRVRGLTRDSIAAVVDRVPDAWLSAADRRVVLEGLLARRDARLSEAFRFWVRPGPA